MTRRYLPPALLLTLLLGVAWRITNAQEIAPVQEEELTMEAGTVFEILAVTEKPTTQVSWVLTEHRDFVEASRTPLFRIRLTKPGDYSLDAGTFDPDTGKSARKPIRLKVVPPQNATPAEPTAPDATGPLIESIPPLDKNAILLTTDILKVTGRFPGQPLALDLDAETDSNGDGNPANDQETARTFFESDGTSLHIWFSAAKKKRIIALNAPGRATEQISIFERGTILGPVLQATPGENGTIRFTVQTGESVPPGPLLYHWYFGDDAESLLENPEHSYARNDTYVVRLQIQNLESGQRAAEAETSVEIRNAGTVTTDPNQKTPAKEEPAGANGTLWTILTYLVGLLIAVAIGLGIVYLIARLRRDGGLGLQKKLEQIESSIVKKDAPIRSATDIAPPMELKRAERTDAVEEKKPAPPKPAEKTTAPPSAPETPAWLKKGIEKAEDVEKKTPTPPPTPPAAKPLFPPPPVPIPKPPVPPPPAPIPSPISPKPTPVPPAVEPPKPAPASKPSILAEPPKSQSLPPAVSAQEPPKPPVLPAPKKPEPALPPSPSKSSSPPNPSAHPSPAPSGTDSASATGKATPKLAQALSPPPTTTKPVEPKTTPASDQKDDDEPIAFVRAEGVDDQK